MLNDFEFDVISEAATGGGLKISQNSQENTYARV